MLNKKAILIHSMMILPMLVLGAASAQAITIEEVEAKIAEADQLRAREFAPEHYAAAKEALENAKAYMSSGKASDARHEIDSCADNITIAISATERLNDTFSELVESRDRMQMADPANLRDDLVERAEKDFGRVVESVEDGDVRKAEKDAKLARDTIHAAQVVAAREAFSRPIAKGVAAARKVKAREYAPKAYNKAIKAQSKVEALIKNDPDAQEKMFAVSKNGQSQAERAMKIAELGSRIDKNPAEIETLVDAEEARLNLIGKRLGIDLSNAKDSEEQALMLQQAIADMEKNYQQQLAEADAKLAKYEGDLAGMAEMRRKLQLKRDAEAKIKRLTKLFNKNDVEILLTPDADVILRMKTLNFRSGSAVIPPNTYVMLDNASQAMIMFNDRAVRVEGHTDSMGANTYNQKLSERRADAVRTYLAEKLQGTRAIDAVGFGEEKPIANNETAKGREKNRRIDIVLLAPRS